MPTFNRAGAEIYFETYGQPSAPAVLLIAPGGMRSAISFWDSTPWSPIAQLQDEFYVVAMDQRNAGRSIAPVSAQDGWSTYTDDQLGLMDSLGISNFHVAGMCIGGPYCFGLIEQAPARIKSATLFQTIGRDDNAEVFFAMFDDWANKIKDIHPEASEENWSQFRQNMYGGDKVFFNVDAEFVAQCSVPLLVFMGDDVYHPQSSSRLIAQEASNVVFVSNWKEGQANKTAQSTFRDFLRQHN